MSNGMLKARVRAAVFGYCERMGDCKEHARACISDIFDLIPPEEWEWFADYFEKAGRIERKYSEAL